jgi:hypothetical protein
MRLLFFRYLYGFGICLILIGCSIEQSDNQAVSFPDSTKGSAYNQSDTLIPIESRSDRVAQIQERLRNVGLPSDTTNDTPGYRLDIAPYNHFLNPEGYLDLLGTTLDEIQEVLGDSPILVRQSVKGAPLRREIRVYFPYQEDATGLYLFFENEKVIEFRMDEFNGIIQSGILDYMK